MRWTKPRLGATKVVSKFLFLPMTLFNKETRLQETRWLEWANIVQRYSDDGSLWCAFSPVWVNSYWAGAEQTEENYNLPLEDQDEDDDEDE